jgi:hypothetical protein
MPYFIESIALIPNAYQLIAQTGSDSTLSQRNKMALEHKGSEENLWNHVIWSCSALMAILPDGN